MTNRTNQTKSNLLWLVLFVLSFLGLIALRFHLIHGVIATVTGCSGYQCHTWQSLLFDARILALLLVMIGIAAAWRNRLIKASMAVAGVLVIVLFAVDIFTMHFLSVRLTLRDLFKFSGEFNTSQAMLGPIVTSTNGKLLIALLLASCITMLGVCWRLQGSRKLGIALLASTLVLLGLRWLPNNGEYVVQYIYRDYLTNNLPGGDEEEFSDAFKQTLAQTPLPQSTCTAGAARPRPVILLLIESFSLYQSKLLSGMEDYTPELDQVIRRYAYLDKFYANGFTTDAGMIALFTGLAPLPGVKHYQSTNAYSGYEAAQQDLFARLTEQGIPTQYFTSAGLAFLDTGDWLAKLGFQMIEGPEHPFYAGMPRGVFSDPGDKALYDRYLQWLDGERAPGPFFSVIKTITTHIPFVLPDASARGEEAAFRYADKAAAEFVAQLEKRDFFNQDGLLIITGDHRSLTVERPGEKQKLGEAALARVPAILVGKEYEKVGAIAGQWQQMDLIPSVLSAMSMQSCVSSFQGRFLPPLAEPRYVLHVDGAYRDRVLVKIKGKKKPVYVHLNGDDTNWLDTKGLSDRDNIVLTQIDRQRAQLPTVVTDHTRKVLQSNGFLKQ